MNFFVIIHLDLAEKKIIIQITFFFRSQNGVGWNLWYKIVVQNFFLFGWSFLLSMTIIRSSKSLPYSAIPFRNNYTFLIIHFIQYIQGVPEFVDTKCIAWFSVPKEVTFFFGKIVSEHYFLNESNLNLTNKRSRLRMNQGRRAHGVRGAWACTLLYYFAKDFIKTMGGGGISKYRYFEYNLLNKRTFSNWQY